MASLRRLVPVLTLLAAACSLAGLAPSCAAEPACAADTDCPAGQVCKDGTCAPLDTGGATAGTCASEADCSSGELCLDGRCVLPSEARDLCASEKDPTCGDEQLCAVDPLHATCPEGETSCVLPFACVAPVGELAGAMPCTEDAECRSGLCVAGACLRACTVDGSCPYSFVCRERELGDGRRVRTCIGAENGEEQPLRTLCRGDRDCVAPRICRFEDVPSLFHSGRDFGVCMEAPIGALAFGERCWDGGTPCEGGFCRWSCQTSGPIVCSGGRCLQPCQDDIDCPPRFTCQNDREEATFEGAPVRFCALPFEACYDDVDCCPTRTDEGFCRGGWLEGADSHCAIVAVGDSLQTRCQPQAELGTPASPCETAADCTSNLCVEAPAGFPDPSVARICSSPCDVDPRRDRCAQAVHPLTSCQESVVELSGQSVPMRVCR